MYELGLSGLSRKSTSLEIAEIMLIKDGTQGWSVREPLDWIWLSINADINKKD